jgi:hypothetical protein
MRLDGSSAGQAGGETPGTAGPDQEKTGGAGRESKWRALWSSPWTVTIVGGLAVAIVGGIILARLTSPAAPAKPASAPGVIPAGYYVNGYPETPHWFLLVSASRGAAISGTLAFVGQDGQTGEAQSFSGQLSNDLLTLDFSRSGTQTGQADPTGHPAAIDLNACTAYLQLAVTSLTQCQFFHAADLQGDQG